MTTACSEVTVRGAHSGTMTATTLDPVAALGDSTPAAELPVRLPSASIATA